LLRVLLRHASAVCASSKVGDSTVTDPDASGVEVPATSEPA